MKIHITNLYNFNSNDALVKKQHRIADAARDLGFTEMGIFSYPVETDTPRELSKRLDGIIAALEPEDVVCMQLPTGNGFEFEYTLFQKIKAYPGTKVFFLLHDTQMLSDITDTQMNTQYLALFQRANGIIAPSHSSLVLLEPLELRNLFFYNAMQPNNISIKRALLDALETGISNNFSSDRTTQLEKLLYLFTHKEQKHIFYGSETLAMKNMYHLISLQKRDYRILSEQPRDVSCILPCKSFSQLEKEKKGTYIVFVLPEADNWTAVSNLEHLGLENEKDFFIIPRILAPEQGGYR